MRKGFITTKNRSLHSIRQRDGLPNAIMPKVSWFSVVTIKMLIPRSTNLWLFRGKTYLERHSTGNPVQWSKWVRLANSSTPMGNLVMKSSQPPIPEDSTFLTVRKWRTVLEPDTKVSFQIYAIINYHDRLLLGQYPTGELFSYDGEKLEHIPDWPPAVPEVRRNAREAQTLALFGGDLYAGVWPWGEVWKYSSPESGWQFSGRMFTHPPLTDETTHPYENETSSLGSVLNRWGQRVTSLVPMGNAMYISTSSKGGYVYEPKYTFLANEKWKEYGSVYKVIRPGALAVATQWTTGKTNFEFKIRQGNIEIYQDGKLLGSTPAPEAYLGDLSTAQISLKSGTFGPFLGKDLVRAK